VRYSYLDNLAPTVALNFGAFVKDLMRKAPGAFFPESTKAVAAGGYGQAVKLKRADDYARYLRWVLYRLGQRDFTG
jgi:hypothetical protein